MDETYNVVYEQDFMKKENFLKFSCRTLKLLFNNNFKRFGLCHKTS